MVPPVRQRPERQPRYLPFVSLSYPHAACDAPAQSARWGERAPTAALLTILAGPALFLAGHFLYKWAIFGVISWPRLVAIAAWIVAAFLLRETTPLVIVIVVAAWDARLTHVPRTARTPESGPAS